MNPLLSRATPAVVKPKKDALGRSLANRTDVWTDVEVDMLRRVYAGTKLNLDDFAEVIGRSPGNISRKARTLGLTRPNRPKHLQIPMDFKRGGLTPEETRALQSKKAKLRIARDGHPRHMLGKKHTAETLGRMSSASKAMWADPNSKINSPEQSQRRSDHMVAMAAAGKLRGGYSRGAGGRRADLDNRYFRSSWEANYARLLNFLVKQGEILSWEFETKTFVFEAIKRGTRAYTPDFKVMLPDGSYEWHEVKGWLDQKSRTRLKRMAKYFPEEKIVLRDAAYFKKLNKSAIPGLLPNWEFKRKNQRGIAEGLGIDDASPLVRYLTTQQQGEPRQHCVRAELFISTSEVHQGEAP